MKIDFMDITTGEVYASSSAVTTRNGKLVPDSLGLPALTADECLLIDRSIEEAPGCCDTCRQRGDCPDFDFDTIACRGYQPI